LVTRRQGLATLLVASGAALVVQEAREMQLDPKEVEELSKTLYVRALKLLPPDIKQGFARLMAAETDATGRTILGTMVENIAVAERTRNLLCQDTGIPIYNVTVGRNVEFDGVATIAAIRRGCERATREHPLRSSVVHPVTRKNEQTSCGVRIPIVNFDFDECDETVVIEMIPKGSGSENGSFLQMLIPADGVKAVKRYVIDRVIECGGRVCPPTIVGVGIGGTSDLCMHLAKVAATRPLGTTCADAEGAKIEAELSEAVNALGIGPQGLGGRSTAFRVHVEVAATHITMNPVAVNIQCHSARRANAVITPGGIAFR
jgi:fumarate hydratase subunit alpha/L(+)-tartrate dehydratase alpha subunit